MKKEFGFAENADVKTKIFALADTTLTNGRWTKSISEELLNATLFSMSGTNYPAREFVTYVKQNQRKINQPSAFHTVFQARREFCRIAT